MNRSKKGLIMEYFHLIPYLQTLINRENYYEIPDNKIDKNSLLFQEALELKFIKHAYRHERFTREMHAIAHDADKFQKAYYVSRKGRSLVLQYVYGKIYQRVEDQGATMRYSTNSVLLRGVYYYSLIMKARLNGAMIHANKYLFNEDDCLEIKEQIKHLHDNDCNGEVWQLNINQLLMEYTHLNTIERFDFKLASCITLGFLRLNNDTGGYRITEKAQAAAEKYSLIEEQLPSLRQRLSDYNGDQDNAAIIEQITDMQEKFNQQKAEFDLHYMFNSLIIDMVHNCLDPRQQRPVLKQVKAILQG